MDEIRKEIVSLKGIVADLDQQLHLLKHGNANIQNQVNALYKTVEAISVNLEKLILKYEGNAEVGFSGKMAQMENDIKILKDAYEIGKMWKIKISGFFMAITFFAGFVGVLVAIGKGLTWLYDNFLIIKK